MALLNKSGISTGQTVTATHITNIYDTFNESGSFTVQASGSFSGSFQGNGSALTGITSTIPAGTVSGSAQLIELGAAITGSAVDFLHVTASGNISSSGAVTCDTLTSTGITTLNRVRGNNTTLPNHVNFDHGISTLANITASSGNIRAHGHVSASTFFGDGAGITGIISSSYALTASHALNSSGGGGIFSDVNGHQQTINNLIISSSNPTSSLTVIGSGSTVFDIIGSVGTLFSVDDDLSGTLFSANDVSGLPVLKAEANGEVYLGKSPQSLYTTAVISSNTANITQSIHGLSTSSYDGAFFEYTAISGSAGHHSARAGSIMAIWSGSAVNFTETTTTDHGDTSNLIMQVAISQSQAQIQSYSTTAGYKIKTIIKAI
jgi:hypothetical protein